ncbi:MAG TPA: YegP family protein [Ferruginibacter sp.]|nr:YegP family protein [Ferruginibacter sp.]HRO06043.1 YegP family protein [Ferruginibacter sp.]HRO95703.1 YegP family protein [Ferruginibacter sp.]HRP49288.1 YegP family protein [Ferruginibacter sp.]
MTTFIISKRKNDELQFVLKATNGQTILMSEGYKSMAACQSGIASVKLNALDDHRFERKTSSNGKHYFNLKAANGQVIGTSEMYESSEAMEKGILSVHTNAPSAEVHDESEK